MLGCLGQHLTDVLVEQPHNAHADGNKQQGLGQLEGRDEDEPLIVVLRPGDRLRWGIGHGLGKNLHENACYLLR